MKRGKLLAALLVCAMVLTGTLRAQLPSGWEHTDVGIPPGIPGDASYDEETGVYTLVGDGEVALYDPPPPVDRLHFAFKLSSGDCEIIARIRYIEDVNNWWTRAGVMIRESLDPGARCALMGLTPAGRTCFQYRQLDNEGLQSVHSLEPNVGIPYWVRLVRERNTFTGYYSEDGEGWRLQTKAFPLIPGPNDPAEINMGFEGYIGLFVTSHDSDKLCKAQFDHVRVITPAGTAITYQGYLMDQGVPVNGLHDLRFTVYDTPIGGRQVGQAYDANELDIADGYLVTTLFFGGGPDVFNGEARWLEIAVRPSDQAGTYSVLSPRQRITPAPYAVYANKPVGPKGDQGPPGPKGDKPDHEWQSGRYYLRFEKPDGTWGDWGYLRGATGPPGPIPDHKYDPDTRCLHFEKPDREWGDCIPIGAFPDADWIIDGQDIYRLPGNVGIGTPNPLRPLDVAGIAAFGKGLFARDATGIGLKDDGGALGLWVRDGGNVGVRTAEPEKTLDVNGQGRFDGAIFARDGDGIGFLDDSGALGLWVRDGGNVGVRTNSPTEELDVNGQGRFDGAIYARDGDGIGLLDDSGNHGLWVRDGGNVGVGTGSPDVTLEIHGNERIAVTQGGIVHIHATDTDARLMLDGDEIQAMLADKTSAMYLNRLGGDLLLAAGGGRIGIGTTGPKIGVAIGDSDTGLNSDGDGKLDIWSNNTKTASIRPGRVGIGVEAPTEALDVSGTARLRQLQNGSGTPVVADGNGKLWKESSSRRYKANVRDLQSDPQAILTLRPVRFQWKTTGQEEIGLIAEDVAEVASDLVIHDGEGRPEGVKYNKLSLYLLSIIRTQQEQIKSLEGRIESLERTAAKKMAVAKEIHDER